MCKSLVPRKRRAKGRASRSKVGGGEMCLQVAAAQARSVAGRGIWV